MNKSLLALFVVLTCLTATAAYAGGATIPPGAGGDVGGANSGGAGGKESSHATDQGRMVDPLADPNGSADLLPISIAGVSVGGNPPPTIHEPTVCECPSHFFGIPMVGVGITYWEPTFVAEVTHHPGRRLTLDGDDVLSSYQQEFGAVNGNSSQSTHHGENRAQVHWYVYPIFKPLGFGYLDGVCLNNEGTFDLAGLTEVDPTWQDDIWANIFSPESALFANPVMQLAYVADAVAASVSYPLDPLFWCAGAWGPVYPFSGNPNTQSSDQGSDALVMSKYLAREFRLGLMWATIGPEAICSSTPSPVWFKTEFRVDPIYPHPIYGSPIYIGQTEVRWGLIPPANDPTEQDAAYLLWVAHQCCLRF